MAQGKCRPRLALGDWNAGNGFGGSQPCGTIRWRDRTRRCHCVEMRAPAASEKNPGPAARESAALERRASRSRWPTRRRRGHVPPAGLTQPRRADPCLTWKAPACPGLSFAVYASAVVADGGPLHSCGSSNSSLKAMKTMTPMIAAKKMAGKETVDSSMLSACYPLDLFFRDARPAAPHAVHCFSLVGSTRSTAARLRQHSRHAKQHVTI